MGFRFLHLWRAGVLSLALIFSSSVNANAAMQSLHGHVPAVVKNLQPIDHLESSRRMNLTIGLPLRNREALTNLLRDIYNPASPHFHQYLTTAQFADQFGPTAHDYEAVKRYAQDHGFIVTRTHSNRLLVDVNGSVADIEKTFHLHLRTYQHPNEARTFFAPDAEPSMDFDVPVAAIGGLDNFVLPHPLYTRPDWDADDATNATPFVTGSGPGGFFVGNDFRAAYAPGVALNGLGQSVGLFELDGYFPSDVTDYEALAKLPNVTLTNILLDGVSGQPGSENVEVTLDIDMAIDMAPGLYQVMVYEGLTPNDVLNQMAIDNQARQLSSSWSFSINATTESIYQEFAAQGQSMFQASGDSGAYGGMHVIETPCDDPNITIVGGTSLTTTGPGGAYLSESAWQGSGGGVSTTYPIPSWQQGVNMSANNGSTTKRNLPDVACLADVSIWLIADDGDQGSIGGSSASTPLWAGFAALANQQAAALGRPPIGFINPVIYGIGESSNYPAAFHDIITGNNTNFFVKTNFFAVPGYDLCTGWGSPTGSNLINALVSPPPAPPALNITPVTNLLMTGPVGGPFTPPSQPFILTNIGTNSLGWVLGVDSSWFAATPAYGSLFLGGASTAVTVSATPAANSLLPGSYTGTIWFTNWSGSLVAESRQVVLDVVTPPTIIQQPVSQNVPLGGNAIFTVGVANNALLFYQWQLNGTNLSDGGNVSGSMTGTLTFTNVSAANVGTYRVVVSNAANAATSHSATLAIISSAPVILTQPVSLSEPQGAGAVFSVTAAGNAPLVYQWQYNHANLSDGATISGSTSNILTLSNLQPANAGTYSVIVSNSLGATSSSNAVLNVPPFTAPGVAISDLYSFTGGLDGSSPNALMLETNGSFYGTTLVGGTSNFGTFFQMTPAGALTTVFRFSRTNSGPTIPVGSLVQGPDGLLYGASERGGLFSLGTVYNITTNGIVNKLADFDDSDGEEPLAGVTFGSDGNIYGTASLGGNNNDGTVYQITTNGINTLAMFDFPIGAEPWGLVQGVNGSFYGTTFEGGPNGNGTVFEVNANGTLFDLATFNYTNGGSLPYMGLTLTPEGNFLGATLEGGANGLGSIFEITPAGALTTLYSFTGGSDGAHPECPLIQAGDGNYYGTTAYGGTFQDGAVFRMAPNGTVTSLAQFDGFDGANPHGPLVQGNDGNLYGTTVAGGPGNAGVIYRVNINSPTLQITTQPASQIAFCGANVVFEVAVTGNAPISYQWKENGTNLTDGPDVFGSTNRTLTLLSVNPAASGVYSVLVSNASGSVMSDFAALGVVTSPPQIITQPASQIAHVGGTAVLTVQATGDLPLTYQWQENGTNLNDGNQIAGSATSVLIINNLFETNSGTYSVIVSNSVAAIPSDNAVLTVYAISTNGTTMSTVYSFTGSNDGGFPNGLIVASNGLLYGTTQFGGAFSNGTVFSLSTNGVLNTLVTFDGTNGANPSAGLCQGVDGSLYGTTQLGGGNSAGTVFRMSLDGTLTTLFDFSSNTDSANPFTALVQDPDGNFFGVSSNTALPDIGDLFVISPGGVETNLHFFTGGADGSLPQGPLALGPDGNYYDTSGEMGPGAEFATNYGNVFRMTPDGTVTNIYSFKGLFDGFSPAGPLVLGSDGNFYGVTKFYALQGELAYGTIFKITPGGQLTTLYALNGVVVFTDGAIPVAGLLEGSGGNFYGTTLEGYDIFFDGLNINNSLGTVFQITPTGKLTTITAFNGTDDGAYPRTVLVEGPDGALYGTSSAGGLDGWGTIYRIVFTSAPQITTDPVSQTNVIGGTASFNVTDFGAPQISYQWLHNGANLSDNASIIGSTSRILTLNNLSVAQSGNYSVIVSNSLGWVTSTGASLTVAMQPIFQTTSQTGGNFSFTWNATPGRTYQLQSTTNLALGPWTNWGAQILATNNTLGASDAINPSYQKFYRVIQLP